MIKFTCSDCSRPISVDDKHSGKKGKCPKCGSIVIVPGRSTIIEFRCESCGHKIKVPDGYAGKRGRCPKCKNPVAVPSLERTPAEGGRATTITCPMCDQTTKVPEGSSEGFTECPACGSYIDTASEATPAVPEGFGPAGTTSPDEDIYEGSSEGYAESRSGDRRLIVIISAVAAVFVVGLVILVAVLQLSRPKPQQQLQRQVADTSGSQTETESSIGLSDSGTPSQSGGTVRRQGVGPPPGRFLSALLVVFAIGTLSSAGCLWVGMKIVNVDGTFAALIGIAAISSLASLVPTLIGLMPCVGLLIGPIVMFVLIFKWTTADSWPEAIGMVLIAGVLGILARVFLGSIISMA